MSIRECDVEPRQSSERASLTAMPLLPSLIKRFAIGERGYAAIPRGFWGISCGFGRGSPVFGAYSWAFLSSAIWPPW